MSEQNNPGLEQLKRKSPQEIKAYKAAALKRKAELEGLKANKEGWTTEMQEELDDIALFLVDADEVLASIKPAVPAAEAHLIHAKIVHGRRFNPNTGKEESHPYVQKFTRSEWALFEKHAKLLGYTVLNIIHKPA